MSSAILEALLDVFQSSVDPMLIADRRGVVLHVNAALKRQFGLPPGDNVGLNVSDLIPKRLRECHSAHLTAYFESPIARPMGGRPQLYGMRTDGSEFAAEISLSPLAADRVLATVRDVSAGVEAARQSRQWAERYASVVLRSF